MTSVAIRLPTGLAAAPADSWRQAPASKHPSHQARQPKLRIRSIGITDPRIGGVLPLEVPFAPVQATRSGLAPVYVRTPRPGRPDAVARNNDPTPTLSLALYFARPDYRQSVEGLLTHLERIAQHDDAVIVQGYGPAEVGPWYIDTLSIEVSDRVPGTNEASRATANVTFVKATEGSVKHGPLSTTITSGHGTMTVIPSHPTYTVRKGDSLHSIAVKIYNDANVLYLLAAVNHIKNPRKELRVGRVLKTPPLQSSVYGQAHG